MYNSSKVLYSLISYFFYFFLCVCVFVFCCFWSFFNFLSFLNFLPAVTVVAAVYDDVGDGSDSGTLCGNMRKKKNYVEKEGRKRMERKI